MRYAGHVHIAPIFAAASGDRIGVWEVNDILQHLHNQSIGIQKQAIQKSSKRLTAIWHTKVVNHLNYTFRSLNSHTYFIRSYDE